MKTILFNKYITLDCALEKHYRESLSGRHGGVGKHSGVNPINLYKERVKNDYTIIILGKAGPTGKTWLTNKLNEKGWKAIEIGDLFLSHSIVQNGVLIRNPWFISYNDNNDHVIVEDDRKVVVMILNQNIYGEKGEN